MIRGVRLLLTPISFWGCMFATRLAYGKETNRCWRIAAPRTQMKPQVLSSEHCGAGYETRKQLALLLWREVLDY